MAKKDGYSFQDWVAIGIPIAWGAHSSYTEFSKHSSFFGKSISTIPKPEHVRQFTNRYLDLARIGTIKDWQVNELLNFSEKTKLPRENILSIFTDALNEVDPSGMLASTYKTRLNTATSASELYKDILNISKTNNSLYFNKALAIFSRNINIFEKRAAEGVVTNISPFTVASPKIKTNISMKQLDKAFAADLKAFSKGIGAQFKLAEYSRKDVANAGKELSISFLKGGRTWFSLNIPRTLTSNQAIISSPNAQYISGLYGIMEQGKIVSTMNHEQFIMRRAVEELLPTLMNNKNASNRAVRSLVRDFSQQMRSTLEILPSNLGADSQALEEYIKIRSNVMNLYTSGETAGSLRTLNEFELAAIVGKGGLESDKGFINLYPSASASQIARGVLSTVDPREASLLVPEAMSFSRRPAQYLRPRYNPTEPFEIFRDFYTKKFNWAKTSTGVDTPMLRALYSPSSKVSEGYGFLSQRTEKLRSMYEYKNVDIGIGKVGELKEFLDPTKSSWEINKTLPSGSILGYSRTGKPITLKEDTFITQARLMETKTGEQFIRAQYRQEYRDLKYSKVFGGAKGMFEQLSPPEFSRTVKELTNINLREGIDTIISMDEFAKNRALHYNQMFTALWDFTKKNIDSGRTTSAIASNFANDPRKVINALRKEVRQEGKFNHELMLSKILDLSKEANLSAKQFGLTFGAVENVFGTRDVLGPLTAKQSKMLDERVAYGATQLFFAGLGGTGAGKRATIEPREFELYDSPHFGSVSGEIKDDIIRRMIAQDPSKLLEQQALFNASLDLGTGKKIFGAIDPSAMLKQMEIGIPLGGQTVSLPGKLGDIIIPEVTQVGNRTDLYRQYKNLFESAIAGNQDEIQQNIFNLRKELNKQAIGTISGKGGLLRGRKPGSMFLTAVRASPDIEPGTVGITEKYAKRMFKQMSKLNIYDQTALKEMEKRFLAGESIAGIVGRHPYIGQYSTQVVRYKKIAGNKPIAMVGGIERRAIAMQGKVEGIALENLKANAAMALKDTKNANRVTERLGAEAISNPIRISPMVGLSGDYDGDIISAMFAGPQLEKSLTAQLDNPNTMRAYEDFAIRSQLLKAKQQVGDVTLKQIMSGDVFKLNMTEGGRLGTLSSHLQQYKAATLAGLGGMSEQTKADALSLLEWMEQAPISSKHVAPGQEEKMVHLVDDLVGALEKKEANSIANAANIILQNAKMTARSGLREGFTIAMESIDGGEPEIRHIRGLNIDQLSKNIANAREAYDTTITGKTSMAQARRIMMGKSIPGTLEGTKEMLDSQFKEAVNFGELFTATAPKQKLGAEISEYGLSLATKLGQSGKSMISMAKPLLLGTGAAIGIATLLSSPPSSLDIASDDASVSKELTKSSIRRGEASLNTDINPVTRISGLPTTLNPVRANNTARIAPNFRSNNQGLSLEVTGTSNSNTDYNSINEQIYASLGTHTRINTIIRDNRKEMTPQRIHDMLER